MTQTNFVDPDLGKPADVLCAERTKRFQDALVLGKPDRIPVSLNLSYLVAEMGGITKQALHEDPALAQDLLEKAALYLQADSVGGVFGGPEVGRVLGDHMMKWPGYGLGPNDTFQFVEDEYMRAEDYEKFLLSPADFGIRFFNPRIATRLEGLADLSHLAMTTYGSGYANVGALLNPRVKEAFSALKEAALVSQELGMRGFANMQRMSALGFPPPFWMMGGMAAAPFDGISDTLRGMRGVMLDMHRRPDLLLAAIEKMRIMITKNVIEQARVTGIPYAGSMLHRGSDGFMSLKQFEKFYWPSLKQMWLDFIAEGITPFVFYEGAWDQRLEYLQELPKGKTIGMFQSSDIFRVKEMLGDTMCIVGGMPNSMLTGGTVEQIRAHTKELCEKVGQDGGFIMGTQIGEMEGSQPELVKAWVLATKEFGRY